MNSTSSAFCKIERKWKGQRKYEDNLYTIDPVTYYIFTWIFFHPSMLEGFNSVWIAVSDYWIIPFLPVLPTSVRDSKWFHFLFIFLLISCTRMYVFHTSYTYIMKCESFLSCSKKRKERWFFSFVSFTFFSANVLVNSNRTIFLSMLRLYWGTCFV